MVWIQPVTYIQIDSSQINGDVFSYTGDKGMMENVEELDRIFISVNYCI